MKRYKRLLSGLLVFVMLLSLLPVSAFAAPEEVPAGQVETTNDPTTGDTPANTTDESSGDQGEQSPKEPSTTTADSGDQEEPSKSETSTTPTESSEQDKTTSGNEEVVGGGDTQDDGSDQQGSDTAAEQGNTIPLTIQTTPPPASGKEEESTAPSAEPTGTISAELELKYDQLYKLVKNSNIKVSLTQGIKKYVEVDLKESTTKTFDQNQSSEQVKSIAAPASIGNEASNPLCTAEVKMPSGKDDDPCGTIKVSFAGLKPGDYELNFTGDGYTPYTLPITLKDRNMVAHPSNGDSTFSLGDVNRDKELNDADLTMMKTALETVGEDLTETEYAQCDLNGDGQVDITDLAYLHRVLTAKKQKIANPIVASEWIIVPGTEEAFNTALTKTDTKTTIITDPKTTGTFSDLFVKNNNVVAFKSEDTEKIDIPIPVTDPIPTDEIVVYTPVGTGEITNGNMIVEYEENGKLTEKTYPFDIRPPVANVHPITALPGTGVITVNLGGRKAVKKVTISVTKNAPGDYAVLESIQFLEDIVPENAVAPNRKVLDLVAVPGSESVQLSWSPLPNVSKYQIEYYRTDTPNNLNTQTTTAPNALIDGLDNLKEYVFTVTPQSEDGWSGEKSDPVRATPEPQGRPDPPDRVNIQALDGELKVSWQGKDATVFRLFYKESTSAEFTQYGEDIQGTSIVISNLKNDVEYTIYLQAGNKNGWSENSREYTGIPKGIDTTGPELPEIGLVENKDAIKSIVLTKPTNSASGTLTDAHILADGDFSTYWVAKGWNDDEHVEVEFNTAQDLSAVIWIPRLDGDYPKYPRAYSVRVWYEGDTDPEGHLIVPDPLNGGLDEGGTGGDVHTWPNITNYNTRAEDKYAYLPIGKQEKVTKIKVAVEQDGYNLISLSEIRFVKYDPNYQLPEEITALFADTLHSKLAEGVTKDRIDALKTRLYSDEQKFYINVPTMQDEISLAYNLLNQEAGSSVFVYGLESRSTKDDDHFGQTASDLQPLGVTAMAGATRRKDAPQITIYAEGIPEGETVTVYATQFNGEVTAWKSEVAKLTNGRNIINILKIGSRSTDNGGSLYATYSGDGAENIKLHIRRGTAIPMLKLEDWYDISETTRTSRIKTYIEAVDAHITKYKITDANKTTSYQNVTELSLPRVLLSMPALAVKNGLGSGSTDERATTLYNAVLAWEELVKVCEATQGIITTDQVAKDSCRPVMKTRQNIRCMTMFTGAFMYAAGNHVGIGYESCSGMVNGSPTASTGDTNGLYGWGIGHEIGHNMDKLGKAECTNNIYSIMAQTYDVNNNGTLKSRLELEDRYKDIFTKTAQSHPGTASNVFTQLGMYWQLHLAYDGENPFDFYNKFFTAWKNKTHYSDSDSYDVKVAKTASAVTGKDLTEFFTRWGMDLTGVTLPGEEAESRAIWYFSDQSRRDILNHLSSPSGTISAVAEKNPENEKEVLVTIKPDITVSTGNAGIQGYEILRSGKSIGFVLASEADASGTVTYTDVVGSANNRVFEYSVKAYDTLGKVIASADCEQLRISYDAVIPANEYESKTIADGKAELVLTKATPACGIKVIGLPEKYEENFTVTATVVVTGEDNTETEITRTAKVGSFGSGNLSTNPAENAYVTYFVKPDVDTEDTRIWTYDVKKVEISGLPADEALASKVTVELISYVNDDISITAVGKLSEDYVIDADKKETITAGTLVAVGTYRGDPVFGGIRVVGRFSETSVDGTVKQKIVDRAMDGTSYLFAEIPADGAVSTISDGIWIFVFNDQAERELQNLEEKKEDGTTEEEGATGVICDGVNILPDTIKAEFFQTDEAESADSKRTTAETYWFQSPGGDNLPTIVLESEVAG